jgi:hypothetical protein
MEMTIFGLICTGIKCYQCLPSTDYTEQESVQSALNGPVDYQLKGPAHPIVIRAVPERGRAVLSQKLLDRCWQWSTSSVSRRWSCASTT